MAAMAEPDGSAVCRQRSHSIGEALMATAGRPASGSAPRRAAAFTFEGIHYRLLSSTGLQRHVLQGISGINAAPSAQRRLLGAAAPPRGEGLAAVEDTAMMSIMGPSGAGASSHTTHACMHASSPFLSTVGSALPKKITPRHVAVGVMHSCGLRAWLKKPE